MGDNNIVETIQETLGAFDAVLFVNVLFHYAGAPDSAHHVQYVDNVNKLIKAGYLASNEDGTPTLSDKAKQRIYDELGREAGLVAEDQYTRQFCERYIMENK